MPARPDLRDIASNVREAFADLDKDALLDILTFVVKEYVVEGPPPMLVHQAETLADLRTASFAQLIQAMQTRFDFPELAMFVVDGEQVGVRIAGAVQPLIAPRVPLQPLPAAPVAAPAPAQMIDTRPQPGVRTVETPLQQRPTAPAAPPPGSASPPARGLSLRGRPTGGGGGGEGAEAPPAAPPPAAPPAATTAPEKSDKPEGTGSGDDASARFSLLELD